MDREQAGRLAEGIVPPCCIVSPDGSVLAVNGAMALLDPDLTPGVEAGLARTSALRRSASAAITLTGGQELLVFGSAEGVPGVELAEELSSLVRSLSGISSEQREILLGLVRGSHWSGRGRRAKLTPVGISDIAWQAWRVARPSAQARGVSLLCPATEVRGNVLADRAILLSCVNDMLLDSISSSLQGEQVILSASFGERAAWLEAACSCSGEPSCAGRVGSAARAMGGRLSWRARPSGGRLLRLTLSPSWGNRFSDLTGVPASLPGSEVPAADRMCRRRHSAGRPCWAGACLDGTGCRSCMAFKMDRALLSSLPTCVLLASSDEAMLHLIPRCLVTRAGYAVVPVPGGRDLRALAAELRPDLVIIDDYLTDSEAEVLKSDLCDFPETSGIPVITLSEVPSGKDWVLVKPFDDAALVSSANLAILSGRGFRTAETSLRPAVLFWASRPGVLRMLGEMLLDFGLMPVSARGAFDLMALARRLGPHLLVMESELGSIDARSVAALLGDDPVLAGLPFLLLGGDPGWSKSRFSMRLPPDAPAPEVEMAVRNLLRASGVRIPPLLVVEDDSLLEILQAAFSDRYGYRCPVSDSPEPALVATADTVIYQGGFPPAGIFREEWRDTQLIVIGGPPTDIPSEQIASQVRIEAAGFSLPALWEALDTGKWTDPGV